MKKILFFSILLSLLVASHTFAAPVFQSTQGGITSNITVNSSTSVTFNVTFPVVKGKTYNPFACITTDSAGCVGADAGKTSTIHFTDNLQQVSSRPITWTFTQTGLNPAKEYYLTLVGSQGDSNAIVHGFTTGSVSITTPPTISSSKASDNSDIIVTAQVDVSKYPDYAHLTGSLVYSEKPDLSSPVGSALTGRQGPDDSDGAGINTASNPGVFYWRLKVQPSTLYYYQVTVNAPNGSSVKTAIVSFNSAGGTTIVPNTASQQSYNDQHGYTFLSDPTKQTFLPDPDLCAQEQQQAQAAGQTPPKCSINDYLNLAIQILIGLTGVLLVVRLMFVGFEYMTTDLPFKKANAKGQFFTSLMGLLLVLTSYIILNTINPKLVNETVGVQQLSIGIPGSDGLGTTGTNGNASSTTDLSWLKSQKRSFTLSLKNGGNVTVSPCDPSQIATIPIPVFGHSGVQIQKNLVASVERVSAAWQKMSPQYPVKTIGGYNCRTIINSNKISYHAYGMAIDINEDTNPANYNGNTGDMPTAFINLWKAEGWGWGGNWTSYKDPMHFSKGNNEGGDLKGE